MSIALNTASNHGVKYILKPKQTSYVLANQMWDTVISCCETPSYFLTQNAELNLFYMSLGQTLTTPLQSRARHHGFIVIKLPFRMTEKWSSATALSKVVILHSPSNFEGCFIIELFRRQKRQRKPVSFRTLLRCVGECIDVGGQTRLLNEQEKAQGLMHPRTRTFSLHWERNLSSSGNRALP